jgi:hypothetical protein
VRGAKRSTGAVVDKPPPPAVDVGSSEELAQRVRAVVGGREGVTEGTTFGCVAWMVNGNVACGVVGDRLLLRVDRCECERILAEAHVQPMTRGARSMRGFVTVGGEAIADDAELARWLDTATGYAAWLAPKATRPTPQPRSRRAGASAPGG